MQIPIGYMIIGGIILGLITITTGYFFAIWANRKWPVPLRDSVDARLEDIQAASLEATSKLPPLWLSLLPVAIPIVFICAATALHSVHAGGGSALSGIVHFLGDKNMALTIGCVIALVMLAVQKKKDKAGIHAFVQGALLSGGSIILIIAAGGAFGGMLQQTGISMRLAQMTEGYQMALIPLAFCITAVVRTAQGSATVALITASGILSGMTHHEGLAYHPLYIGLAIGCGSKLIWWMNDAGFWVTCKMSNLTEREMLRSSTVMLIIMGFTGLLAILIAAQLFPLK
jgi:GntP family gluconate:H+ symporter